MDETSDLLTLTSDIVSAYLRNNPVQLDQIPVLVQSVRSALANPGGSTVVPPPRDPAVPIKKSVRPDHIVCLEDGRKMKSLKRHLRIHGLTPETYREKWGLPREYPMVAAAYAESRSALAKQMGLGQRGRGSGKKATGQK